MIKLSTLLTGALLVGTAAQAQTTGVNVGLKGGVSLAVLDGTINKDAEFKPGFHAGGFLRWRPTAHFALQPELVYSQQGCTNRMPAGPVTLESKTKLAYLNVPVLAKIYLGKVFHLQAGPQFGLLVAGREVGQTGYYSGSNGTGYQTQDVDVKKDYKGDISVCGGLGADLPMGLTLAARLNYGLSDINNNQQDVEARKRYGFGGIHNRVMEFSVGYVFGTK